MAKDLLNVETGEVIENVVKVITKESQENYKEYLKNKKPEMKVLEPFIRMSKHEKIQEKIYSLTEKSQSRLLKILMSIDIWGRIKYGDNLQQYCRTFNDLAKLKNIDLNSQATINRFRQELIRYDIIAEIEARGTKYLVFNPLIACTGKDFSIIQWLAFRDMIIEYNLIDNEKIKIMDNELAQNGVLFL